MKAARIVLFVVLALAFAGVMVVLLAESDGPGLPPIDGVAGGRP